MIPTRYNIYKWNFETHEYDPYVVPAGVVLTLLSHDMEKEIPCASCFKSVVYGKTYTSRKLHTNSDLGYPVCEDCFQKERIEEEESKNANL